MKKFPIQGQTMRKRLPKGGMERRLDTSVGWDLAEEAYRAYAKHYGSNQSLERIAQRGGFGREELALFLLESLGYPDHKTLMKMKDESKTLPPRPSTKAAP